MSRFLSWFYRLLTCPFCAMSGPQPFGHCFRHGRCIHCGAVQAEGRNSG